MLNFVVRRLPAILPVLLAVSLLTFLIAALLPGDLAYVILGDQATPENVAALRRDMGLDQPLWWRYLSWLGHVLQGRSLTAPSAPGRRCCRRWPSAFRSRSS